jgi:hypothetical protein
MVSKTIAVVAIALVASVATAQAPVSWLKMPGGAADLGANAKGDLWAVGTAPSGADHDIYRWLVGQWVQVPGATAARIAVDPAGNPWVVRSDGSILRYTAAGWQAVPGAAMDIGIGANGAIWIIGRDQSIWHGTGQPPYRWEKVNGGAIRVAVDPVGNPWVVNSAGQIYHLVAGNWILLPGAAKDIAVDAVGIVYAVGAASAPGGFVVNRLLGQTWVPERAAGENIAAGGSGAVYLAMNAASGNAIEARDSPASVARQGNTITTPLTSIINQPMPSPTSLQVAELGYTPITAPAGASPLVPGLQYVHVPGSLLCSDPEVTGRCGTVDAGHIGAYQLNMTCARGFYDPINGGSCWKCPDNDGNQASLRPAGAAASANYGQYIRSADPVTSDTACWRNVTRSAVWDKHGMAWDCSGSQFWDTQDQNRNVAGSCWHCPPDASTRSADAVQSSTACYSHQTSPAIFITYNGCPKPDKTRMYPNDKRRPGEAFVDVSGVTISTAGFQGAQCYACPVSDENGNYLIAPRGPNSLLNRAVGNNGCRVDMKYQPGTFVEPGLSGLAGVSDVLTQEQVFQRPNSLTKYLFAMAAQRKLSGAQATQWVSAQWKDIAAHPYQNDNVRALVYQYMLGHAPTYMYASGMPSGGAEKRLVTSFQGYIQARRTHVAQEALDMYYAWKKNLDNTRASHAQSQLQTMFYYGTVPLDFGNVVAAALVPGSVGVGVLTATWAGETFNLGMNVGKFGTIPRAMTLWQVFTFDTFSELDAIAQLDVVSGPVGIAFAGATMAAMSIQQVVQIATAEQGFKDARDKAKNTTIDLLALYNSANGADQVALYWADATGVASEPGDHNINAAAQSAYAAAEKANFAH